MSYERLWERLLEFLNEWGAAAEVSPGRIEVRLRNPGGSTRLVEILMTPDEWDDMAAVAWGDFESAAHEVKRTLLGMREHERFLVYGQYELVASETRKPPLDPETTRMTELARQHPEGAGRWVVGDPDGNVADGFRSHRD